jgi:hypothetical protein
MADKPPKRVQRPSVPNMTVQQERKCLAEIRSQGENISPHYILKNGQKAGEFALAYVLGQHAKRQQKNGRPGIVINPGTNQIDQLMSSPSPMTMGEMNS